MSKPEWKDAPEWAMWLAQDEPLQSGGRYWVWFECEPDKISCGWVDFGLTGRWLQTQVAAKNKDWQSTLEQRPC